MPIRSIVFDAYGTLYDVQSVQGALTEICGPKAMLAATLWRQKQLEYTWLRSLMEDYEDFSVVTRASLEFALESVGIEPTDSLCRKPMEKYLALDPYPEALGAMKALSDFRLAILSNGSPAMLDALVKASGAAPLFADVISVDLVRTYKPSPKCYDLVEQRLSLARDEVLFVSSNSFDIAGAKRFGFTTAWVERLSTAPPKDSNIGPAEFYRAMRGRPERLKQEAHASVSSLADLPTLLATLNR